MSNEERLDRIEAVLAQLVQHLATMAESQDRVAGHMLTLVTAMADEDEPEDEDQPQIDLDGNAAGGERDHSAPL